MPDSMSMDLGELVLARSLRIWGQEDQVKATLSYRVQGHPVLHETTFPKICHIK